MDGKRKELLEKIWREQDNAYVLMKEYDSMPHHYGENVLYQAEGELIDQIALHPETTMTELAEMLQKTPSACSQIIRKLKKKGIVEQVRNKKNNREYNLKLTEFGQRVFESHVAFTNECKDKFCRFLEKYTNSELENHLQVQKVINEAYKDDIEIGKEAFASPEFFSGYEIEN